MREFIFSSEALIEAPLEEVFAFFSQAENLQKLTPPSLDFKIVTPLPIQMKEGALISYRLRLKGIPLKWLTEISLWNPNSEFVDTQLKGPYVKWVHHHTFQAEGDATRMTDVVTYAMPGGFIGELAHKLFVAKEVDGIFAYRNKVIHEMFPATS